MHLKQRVLYIAIILPHAPQVDVEHWLYIGIFEAATAGNAFDHFDEAVAGYPFLVKSKCYQHPTS